MSVLTRDEFERLKQNWLADPCYDLDDLDDLGEFADEAREFAAAQRERWRLEREQREIAAAAERKLALDDYRAWSALDAGCQHKRERARELARHYIGTLPGFTQRDNYAEIDQLVDTIIDAAIDGALAAVIDAHKRD